MSYSVEKSTGDLIISGFEAGVANSPHKGIGNLQGVNIATESTEVMCSFARVNQTQVGTSGSLTQVNTNTVSVSGITLLVGQVITITGGGTTGLTGDYYYLSTGKLYAGALPPNDPDSATAVTGITAGTATFTIKYSIGQPFQSATEIYHDSSNNTQYRYYILDTLGQIWCHDSATLANWNTPLWFFVGTAGAGASGLAVLNGWLYVSNGILALWKLTVLLGNAFSNSTNVTSLYGVSVRVSLVGHQGVMYVSDGNTIASFFPNTSLVSGFANIQSYANYTAVTTTGTIVAQIGGTKPSVGIAADRIPALFFTNGTLPTAIVAGVIYWIVYTNYNFQVFGNASGGSALDIQTGSSGKQYFNTFDPTTTAGQTMLVFTFQRINLPFFETVTALAEIGNMVMIGGTGNVIYPWNQVDILPSNIITLPESNTANIITVNNMAYIFTGQKGNIYITNGSAASGVISVPDFCAGIAGTPNSYIEPYFTWGGAMYLRGRVYFSILDQTATKVGNCGGVWSFIPSQSLFYGNNDGLALRMENQSSYGTYSGVSPVLLANQNQSGLGPQYWNGWYSSITSPTYGIDYTNSIPQIAIIETDLIPTGTMLNNKTFEQIEYKLSAPLVSGDSVAISYRQNSTDAYVSCGTVNIVTATDLSGYFVANFQNGQWLQLKLILTPLASSSSSFIRLREIRIR